MTSAQPESLASSSFRFHWEYLLTTGFLACGVAAIASALSALQPQQYKQLVVGYLTFHLGAKQPDYVLLFSLIVSFFLIYAGFYYLAHIVRQRQGALAEVAFRQLLIFALLPFAILLGKTFVYAKNLTLLDVEIEFLAGSFLLVLVTIGFALGLSQKYLLPITEPEYMEVVGGSVLFVAFSLFGGIALSLTLGRFKLDWQLLDRGHVAVVSGVGAFFLALPLLKLWLERFSDISHTRVKLRRLLWAIQGFLPLFFFLLLPTPWINGTAKLQGYSITPALLVFVGACVAIAYVDWFRRFKPSVEAPLVEAGSTSSLFAVVSPIGLIALLLYLKTGSPFFVPGDDYHLGEWILPWWLWQTFHFIPFWDYEPARGLIECVVGLFANLLFDGTLIAYMVVSSNGLVILLYLSISFLVLAPAIGIMPAFLACLLMPMGNGFSETDVMSTVVLCSLGFGFFRWRWTQWLIVWAIASPALVLFAPGQGGLLFLAMLPLAGFAFVQAAVKERRRLMIVLAGGLLLALLLGLATPFGKMLLGAVRYVAEQSSINSVAHGIPWSQSPGIAGVSYVNNELMRTAWIFVDLTAGLLLFRAVSDKTWAERYRYATFGVPIFLVLLLFIPRAAGRIDFGDISRLGQASRWAVCLLLPIMLITAFGQRKKALSLMLVAVLGGTLVGVPVPESLLAKPARTLDVTELNSTYNADLLGLPNLAHSFLDPARLSRLQAIKPVLNTIIDPGETYLDLTSQNAQYFYFGYPPPIESGALYNLPHRKQQLRAIRKLEAAPPPIVLAFTNQRFKDPGTEEDWHFGDSGTVALRSYLLYRYVAERYIPIAVDQIIYMVRPDRLERLKTRLATIAPNATIEVGETQAKRLRLLDKIFLTTDLQKIPRAWGLSFESLQASLQPVQTLDAAMLTSQGVEPTGQATYRITGTAPALTFNLETLKLKGRDAGILAFDFASDGPGAPTSVAVSWGSRANAPTDQTTTLLFSAKKGKVLVPLDAAPRWLMADAINTLRIAIVQPSPCQTFSLSNGMLFQRAELQKQ